MCILGRSSASSAWQVGEANQDGGAKATRRTVLVGHLSGQLLAVLSAALLVLACGDTVEQLPSADGGAGGGGDDTSDVISGEASAPMDVPEKLAFGDGCSEHEDCAGGVCLETGGAGVCTQPCSGGCPDGWWCGSAPNPEAGAGADTPASLEVCLPAPPHLCDPCRTPADCSASYLGGGCVALGDGGSFCGMDCDAGCPPGYACSDVTLADGSAAEQCALEGGAECTCSEDAIAASAATDCSVVSEHGTCVGTRACEAAGLGACSAAAPAAEACGGGDENCDGQTDEAGAAGCVTYYVDLDSDGYGPLTDKQCLCEATGDYKADQPGDCDDLDPLVFPGEVCGKPACDTSTLTSAPVCAASGACEPGIDEACPGGFACKSAIACYTDCLLDTHCTSGFFCASGACQPKAADGEPCSKGVECQSDHCDNGFCCSDGTCCSDDADCDDNNACTDDSCGGTAICEYTDNTAECAPAGCQGDTWTSPGLCVGGACAGGKVPQDCGGDDPCQIYSCAPDGCATESASAGTTCGAPSCDGFLLTAPKLCDASGGCTSGGSTAPCAGGYACEDDSSCRTWCAADVHCAPTHHCQTGACAPKKENGQPCSKDTQCTSAHCAGGVCCDSGDCCAADSDCDDNNVCTDDSCGNGFTCQHTDNTAECAPAGCQADTWTSPGTCVGGACAGGKATQDCSGTDPCKEYGCSATGCEVDNASTGASCGAASCSGFLLTAQQQCDGGGGCTLGGATAPCPSGFACADGTDCRAYCSDTSHCAPTHFCQLGACAPKRENGLTCSADAQCVSAHCGGGVCCDGGACCDESADCDDANPCTDDTCTGAFQCQNLSNAAECAAPTCAGLSYTAPSVCAGGTCSTGGETSSCQGTNLCSVYSCTPSGCTEQKVAPGSACGVPACDGFQLTAAQTCDAQGECTLGGGMEPCPGGYTCLDSTSCRSWCSSNGHCGPGFYCKGGACLPTAQDGDPCAQSWQCDSGHCQNGYCCTSGDCCGGEDSHCDDSDPCTDDVCGVAYECTTTNNQAACTEPACSGLQHTAAGLCAAGSCGAPVETDCSGEATCVAYGCDPDAGCTESPLAPGTPCGTGTCEGHTLTSGSVCNGQGDCAQGQGSGPCAGGYACKDASSCHTTCSADEQCAPGFYCTQSLCLPKREDGEVCSQAPQCLSGHCQGGFCCAGGECCAQDTHCDDKNPCTANTCVGFVCAAANLDTPCGQAICLAASYFPTPECAAGECVETAATACGGDDPCKVYGCDVQAGCTTDDAKAGTECGAPSCSGSMLTAPAACDGAGSCLDATPAPCANGYTCLDAATCRTTCGNDNHCQGDFYCGSGICLPKRANGDGCNASLQCASGHCQGGFCCAGGDCCGGNDAHCNDGNACTDDSCAGSFECAYDPNTDVCGPATCSAAGWTAPRVCASGECQPGGAVQACEGVDPCKLYSCSASGCVAQNALPGTVCALPLCDGFELTSAQICDGQGGCSIGGGTEPCLGGFACLTSSSCRKQCSEAAHCAEGYHCNQSKCVANLSNGGACATDGECWSGHCANGFCCAEGKCCAEASDCDDEQVCTTESCVDNMCSSEPNAAPCASAACDGATFTPGASCSDGGCQVPEAQDCSGEAACKVFGCDPDAGCTVDDSEAGVPCGTGSCAGFTLYAANICDGGGACVEGAGSGPCPGGLVCADGSACRTSCETDDHCRLGFYCSNGACQLERDDGEACTKSVQCASAYCNGGFCCGGGACCGGNDAQCNDTNPCTDDVCGATFVCGFKPNTAQCAAGSCEGTLWTTPGTCSGGACAAGSDVECDGGDPCRVYGCANDGCTEQPAPPGAICALPQCDGYELTAAKTCVSAAGCAGGGAVGPCPGGFTCLDESSCRAKCAGDSECAPGYFCAEGACEAKVANGDACAAANQCLSDYCQGGLCCSGGTCCLTADTCGDDNGCTDDLCENNTCTNPPNASPCIPPKCVGQVHIGAGLCAGGVCQPSTDVTDCSGQNPCTLYGCDPLEGCFEDAAPTGKTCGAPSCAGDTLTPAPTCDGEHGCAGNAPIPCPGGTVCLDDLSCRDGCAADAECQAGRVCVDGQCIEPRVDGEPCDAAEECKSGHCDSGYCCADGQCCAADTGCEDENVCTTNTCVDFMCESADNALSCASPVCEGKTLLGERFCAEGGCQPPANVTECTGNSPCAVYTCDPGALKCAEAPSDDGVPCGEGSCVDGVLTSGLVCDGSYSCLPGDGSGPCPGGLTCLDAKSCRAACTADAHCMAGRFCLDGECLDKRPNGQPCASDGACGSGHCENGYCCDFGKCCGAGGEGCAPGLCSGLQYLSAEVCSPAFQCDGASTEECAGTDPCLEYGCSAQDGCTTQPAPGGTVCGAAACAGASLTPAAVCDDDGACAEPGPAAPCADGFVCESPTLCAAACTDSAMCQAGYYCVGGVCAAKRGDGEGCAADAECSSSYCSNGACCQNDGTDPLCCGPAVGCPTGGCAALVFTPDSVCDALKSACTSPAPEACDGENPCVDYACDVAAGCTTAPVAPGTTCGEPSCAGDVLTPAPLCVGQSCTPTEPQLCAGGLTCLDTGSCRATCAAQEHCQVGWYCDGQGCAPKHSNGAACAAGVECSSGYCEGGICCDSGKCCSSPADCGDQNVCTADACVANQCLYTNVDGAQCAAAACDPEGNLVTAKTCEGGACAAGGTTLLCDDQDPCSSDSCENAECRADPIAGCCELAQECDDGQPCTEDFCVAMACQNLPIAGCCKSDADCATGDPCQVGTCSVATGDCVTTPNTGASCDDENQCTEPDACVDGVCGGNGLPNGTPCDDGDPVTQNDVCASGQCTCEAQCTGRECGDDLCGGVCGVCPNESDLCFDADQNGLGDVCVALGDTCDNPFVQLAPFTASGDTSAAVHDHLGLGCTGAPYPSMGANDPDEVYAFTPPTTAVYTLTLATGTWDSSLYVTTGCADMPTTCVAGADAINDAGETLLTTLTKGTEYFIVVDGWGSNSGNQSGPYTLTVEQCAPDCAGKVCGDDGCGGVCGTCANATDACIVGECVLEGDTCANPLQVGDLPFATAGDTTGMEDDYGYSDNACPGEADGWGANAPDAVYRFVVPQSGTYVVELTADFDSNLYIIGDCGDVDGSCVAADDDVGTNLTEQIVVALGGFQLVWIVVDGYGGNEQGTYDLTVRLGCEKDSDCAASQYCSGGLCVAKKANGSSCTGSGQCQSTHCNSGYCCASGKCCTTNSHCNDSNKCTTDTCSSNSCVNKPVSNGVQCNAPTCSGGTYFREDTCQSGICSDAGTESYSCGDGVCHEECETSTSCASDCKLVNDWTLTSGEVERWNNGSSGGYAKVAQYDGCFSAPVYKGREIVYSVTPTSAGEMEVTLSDTTYYMGAMIVESGAGGCSPNLCIGNIVGNGSKTVPVKANETYCVVVDSFNTSTNEDYQLLVQLTQTNGTCKAVLDEDWQRSNWPRAWDDDGPWYKSTKVPFSSYHSRIALPQSYGTLYTLGPELISPSFDATGCSNLKLSMQWATSQPTGSDHRLILWTSINGGTWTVKKYWEGSYQPGEIHNYATLLGAADGKSNVRVGFSVQHNCPVDLCVGESGHWYAVDNVRVSP